MSRVEIGLEISRKKVEKNPQVKFIGKQREKQTAELKSVYVLSVELEFET